MKLIALTAAAMLAAAPAPLEPRARPIVQVTAMLGVALFAMGIGFEITGLDGIDVRVPAAQWSDAARANTAGGAGLMGLGACFVLIAALLTPWGRPPVAVWVRPDGGGFQVQVHWP